MPEFDTVIKGGMVVDGRALPRRKADVAIKDGRVAYVGGVRASDGGQVIDASGLIVAPGFVDLHTHYDSAFFYDPWCTIGGWHGITSVVIGNCGFGFAPAHPDDQDYLMRTLTRVEAIDYRVMKETLPWSWESFPQWMDVLDQIPKGLNALTYVPLNPLIVYVMGLDAAKNRDASDDERTEMARLLREAMDAGACGWSAQRTPPGGGFDMQRDHDGTPFATDLMSNETALAMAAVLADYDHAFIQTLLSAHDAVSDRKHLEQIAQVSNSSMIYNAVAFDSRFPDMHIETLEWIRECQNNGLKIYAQVVSQAEPYFIGSIADGWNNWDEKLAWREATLGTNEQKLAKFRDPEVRKQLKADPPIVFRLDEDTVILRTYTEKFMKAKNAKLGDGARLCGYGDDYLEFFLDMIVADELRTLFQIPVTKQNPEDIDTANALITREPFTLYGVSDGGAHQKFATNSIYTTRAITDTVRERDLITLEECHFRLSALPAYCAGFKDRGTVTPGAAADIVIYDFDRLNVLPQEVAYDLPAGDWRRIQKAEGYRYTLVNGETTFVDGECTKATPGKLLRFGGS